MADLRFGRVLRFAVQTRSPDINDGLAARLADPLWMLARQWQFGEFRGEDAGSPVTLQFHATAHAPTWWRPEPDATQPLAQPWQAWTVRSGPLETCIDAEPDDGTNWVELRLEGGIAARRALLAAGLPDAANRLTTVAGWNRSDASPPPTPTSPIDAALMECTADADALNDHIAPWADPATPVPDSVLADWAISADTAAGFAATMRTWRQWWQRQTAGRPTTPPADRVDPPSWDSQRLEYRGSLGFASNPTVQLHVDRHPGGPLDWYSVDIIPALSADTQNAPTPPPDLQTPTPVTALSVPQPARFAGMPAARFWEFEDARVDFGSTDASGADLARMLLIDYTTVYDHNWYLAPLRLPTAALIHVDQPVTIVDSFGLNSPLDPFAEKPAANTRMFNLSTLTGPPTASTPDPQWNTRWFWFAPRLASTLDSDPIEQIGLRRDEMADLGWAIITNHSDNFGRNVTDYPLVQADAPAGPTPSYIVESPVPLNWIPLVPTPLNPLNPNSAYLLVLQPLERTATGGAAPTPGRLLAGTPWQIHEEELGCAGVTITRCRTLARWHDGNVYTWSSRCAWAGGGEADSGLTWDYLQ
jgi:hypothetical protein